MQRLHTQKSIPYDTIRYDAVQYSIIQENAAEYNTVDRLGAVHRCVLSQFWFKIAKNAKNVGLRDCTVSTTN